MPTCCSSWSSSSGPHSAAGVDEDVVLWTRQELQNHRGMMHIEWSEGFLRERRAKEAYVAAAAQVKVAYRKHCIERSNMAWQAKRWVYLDDWNIILTKDQPDVHLSHQQEDWNTTFRRAEEAIEAASALEAAVPQEEAHCCGRTIQHFPRVRCSDRGHDGRDWRCGVCYTRLARWFPPPKAPPPLPKAPPYKAPPPLMESPPFLRHRRL